MTNSQQPWMVLKFGGTSVSTAARWATIARLAQQERALGSRVLIVVSALSGITDLLKRITEVAFAPSVMLSAFDASTCSGLGTNGTDNADATRDAVDRALALIEARHADLLAQLLLPESAALRGYLDQLRALAQDRPNESGIFAWSAEVLSLGELMSSTLGAAYLQQQLGACGWLDARDWLRATEVPHDSDWARYLSVNCDSQANPSAAQAIAKHGDLLITQGFIARSGAGQTVLLGRGGSDTSASYFGALLGAAQVQIWTDVPGMFSANPRKVPSARLLKRLDYDEAQEIATTGAKVLHPRSLLPLRDAGVGLLIKDTQRPELSGTLIGPRRTGQAPSVKAISVRTGLTLVSMESIGMWQQVGFLADVFAHFKAHSLSVDLIGSSETNVTISLDPSENLINADTLQALCTDLVRVCRVKVIAPCAAITLVGRGIRSLMHRLTGVWGALGEERVHLVTQSSNDLNLTFVLDEERAEALLPVLHAELLRARVLPVDDLEVLGPSWQDMLNRAVVASVPWWKTRAAELIAMAQSGPCYVYCLAEVAARALQLQALSSVDEWFYAMKANACEPVLRTLEANGFAFECVSAAELRHVLSLFPQIARERLLFTPNFAAQQEYRFALDSAVAVTLDSVYPLEHWPELLRGARVHLRLDLGRGAGHHDKVKTGGERSKFGLALDDAARFRELAKCLKMQVIGLHCHLGSGIRDAAHWPRVYSELATLATHFPQVRTLNLGGGLGVPSRSDEPPLDLAALDQRLSELKAMYPPFRVRMEPGRFPVAEAGVLLTKVTQIKSKGQGVFVGVDTGMNSLLRPALYDAYHEIVNLSRLDAPLSSQPCTVVGPICESSDVLGVQRSLPACEEGDVLLIAEAGAYGAVMASHYNLRAPARELVLT